MQNETNEGSFRVRLSATWFFVPDTCRVSFLGDVDFCNSFGVNRAIKWSVGGVGKNFKKKRPVELFEYLFCQLQPRSRYKCTA